MPGERSADRAKCEFLNIIDELVRLPLVVLAGNRLSHCGVQARRPRQVCETLMIKGLTALFDDLYRRKVNLISLRDGLDLSTPAGRLMANVLASVANYETEVRSERQMAGITAAKKREVRFGRPPGTRHSRIPPEKRTAIIEHKAAGWKVAQIARAVGLRVKRFTKF
jgi:DNA invertase Pin-like site-specific DNA recombinase